MNGNGSFYRYAFIGFIAVAFLSFIVGCENASSSDEPGSSDPQNTPAEVPFSTVRTMPFSADWSSVAYGNNTFVAVAGSKYSWDANGIGTSIGGSTAATSQDGSVWTAQTIRPSVNNEWTSIAYGAGLFAAISRSGDISTSTDGITWESQTNLVSNNWSSICFGGGIFVALPGGSYSEQAYSATSIDGKTWTLSDSALPSQLGWRSVTWGNNAFVAVNKNGGAATSADGKTWVSQNLSGAWQSVAFGNGVFVAVAKSGISAWSPDGITWTMSNLPSIFDWNAIAYGNGMFLTGSGNQIAATSTDGATWEKKTLATTLRGSPNAIAFGNNTFVILLDLQNTNSITCP